MMNDVVSTIPLLRLPIKAILNTLRIMNFLQIFGISVLSKKTEKLVESMKLAAIHFQVQVAGCFRVYLKFSNNSKIGFELYQVLENQPLQELGTPEAVRILHGQELVTWPNSMSVTQLLDHLRFIFKSSVTSILFKENCERFSLESVHENVKGIEDIGFFSRNQEHNRKILTLFQPLSITLFAQALVDFRVPKYILIQNFDVVHVLGVQTGLDDLIMANTRFFDIVSRVSTKTVNQFLKLWTKGSNSRLECLFLDFHGNFHSRELLSGLKCQKAPVGVRIFKTSGLTTPREVPNGRDIWRLDGTKATIAVSRRGDLVKLEFYVWHDHCVVN